jgi:hypothetical protein
LPSVPFPHTGRTQGKDYMSIWAERGWFFRKEKKSSLSFTLQAPLLSFSPLKSCISPKLQVLGLFECFKK